MHMMVDGTLPAAAARGGVDADRANWLARLFVVSIFIPEALGFFVFDFRITITRAILLLGLPVIFFFFGELITSGRYRFIWSDLLFPVTAIWMIVALSQTDGLDSALKGSSGGVSAFEFVGSYFLIRSTIVSGRQAQHLVRLFCLVASIAGLSGILDVVFDTHVLRTGLGHLTGYQFYLFSSRDSTAFNDYRLGMLRAEGPLEHPILYGIAMCYALLLSRLLQGWRKRFCWIGCGIGLFLSLSSAPWEALVIGLGLVGYCSVMRVFPAKWTLLTVVLGIFITLIFFISSNPLGWIFNHLTLNAETGYFRLFIWQAAGGDVLESPIFGIGATENWFRPEWLENTVDSLWLRDAMLFGIPGSVLVGLSTICACVPAVRVTVFNSMRVREEDAILAVTLEVIIFLTLFLGFTVFYWGSLWITVAALAGLRACLGQLATQ